MKLGKGRQAFIIFLCCLPLVGLFLFATTLQSFGGVWDNVTTFRGQLFDGIRQKDSVLFVGDVMLARGVESLMTSRGEKYPFSRSVELFARYNHVVGNFEGAIPQQHVQTPPMDLQLSFSETSVPALRRTGFSVMTLANNHGYDFGRDGFDNTRSVLKENDIAPVGHPLEFNEEHIFVIEDGRVRIALIPVHSLVKKLSADEIERVMTYAESISDVQIVLPHWGEEYINTGNTEQQSLAHAFIDSGADAVIGHHPHVVQHIEAYNDALIIYSLGNFIFDQYWNADVQEGLTIGLDIQRGRLTYELIPVTSYDLPSAPRPMNTEEREQFLTDLADRSDEKVHNDIMRGEIIMPLASS